MIRRITLLLILILAITSIGCSSKTHDLKTEDEIKAEIRAEMEADEKLKEAVKAEVKAQLEVERKTKNSKEELAQPTNLSILNYKGKGLEKLEKIDVDCKAIVEKISDDKSFRLWGDDTTDTIAIFGQVYDFEIGYSRWYTDGNYMKLKNFGTVKDTEIAIHRGSAPEDMILVSFTDGGMRKHVYHLMTDEYFTSEDPDEQELIEELSESEKAPSSYKVFDIDLVTQYIGMTEDSFISNNNFENVEKEYDDYSGCTYLKIKDDPIGYNLTFTVSPHNDQVIKNITIMTSDSYNNMENSKKVSIFGVDFDMSIYRARYNAHNSNSDISIEFGRKYDEKADVLTDKLGSIYIDRK